MNGRQMSWPVEIFMQGFVSDGSKAGAIGNRGSIAATRRQTSTSLPWHREDVFKPVGSMLTRRLR
jgi:hypothetical protein